MLIMIHHVHGYYLGCIEVDDSIVGEESKNTNTVNEDLIKLVEVEWWDEFQKTQPDSDSQFIDFLTLNKGASEACFDQDSPNMPLQAYVSFPVFR